MSSGFQTQRQKTIWGFPKIRGTFLWVAGNKNYTILGSILGSPYFGKLQFLFLEEPHYVVLQPRKPLWNGTQPFKLYDPTRLNPKP